MKRIRPAIPWIWTGLVAVATFAQFWVWGAEESPTLADILGGVLFALGTVSNTALAALIATRRPGNRVSWILFIAAFGWLAASGVGPLLDTEPASLTVWIYLALVWQTALTVATMFYPLLLLLHIFPDGRFLNRRWSWPGWFGVIWIPLLLFVAAFWEEMSPSFVDEAEAWTVSNPIGFIPTWVLDVVISVWIVGLIAVGFAGVAAVVVRYRRSSQLVRTQIKWLIYPGLLFAISFLLITTGVGGDNDLVSGVVFLGPIALIPIAITVAILRYRLFEIDRIINRTVVYAIVVAVLAGFYAAAVVLLRGLLPDGSDLAVAASTLGVAALFNPVRVRVQRFVDRRFYRSRYDAERTIEEFSESIGSEVDLDQLTTEWLNTVEKAVKPTAASVWIRSRA